MSDMGQFHTRTKANEGVKLPLVTPDGGATDHYLMVMGIDSDAFRAAESLAKRAIIGAGADADIQEIAKEAALDVVASLVSGWSFDDELTTDNIKGFLRDAPQIANEIDRIAGDRALFFALKSKASKTTRKKK